MGGRAYCLGGVLLSPRRSSHDFAREGGQRSTKRDAIAIATVPSGAIAVSVKFLVLNWSSSKLLPITE